MLIYFLMLNCWKLNNLNELLGGFMKSIKFILFLLILIPVQLSSADADSQFLGKVGQFRTIYLKNDNIFYGEILNINEDG